MRALFRSLDGLRGVRAVCRLWLMNVRAVYWDKGVWEVLCDGDVINKVHRRSLFLRRLQLRVHLLLCSFLCLSLSSIDLRLGASALFFLASNRPSERCQESMEDRRGTATCWR